MPHRFVHMGPFERQIWQRFLDRYGPLEGEVRYDVHLGRGVEPQPDWPEWLKAVVAATSRKRVDAVQETRWEITIYEVKRRASLSALGQLLGYEQLLWEQERPSKPIRLVCVCEEVAPDVEGAFARHGVEIITV